MEPHYFFPPARAYRLNHFLFGIKSDDAFRARYLADPEETTREAGLEADAIGALRDAGLLDRIASLDSSAWHGRIGRDLYESRASPLTQAQHTWWVALPRYLEKVGTELDGPQPAGTQLSLAF